MVGTQRGWTMARNYRRGLAAGLLEATQGGCAYCGVPLDESTVQVDHVDPDKGDAADNYLPCCRPCNSTKGRKSLEQFRQYVENFQALAVASSELELSSKQLGWLLDQPWFPATRERHTFPFERSRGGE